jgi:prepilin-type N-terminal cleavage/methylation domain-containing protein
MKKGKAFTLIELLVVIAIVGLVSGIIIISLRGATDRAYSTRAGAEMRTIIYALNLYLLNNSSNPCDVSRDLPPGLEQYLSTTPTWPKAPWPGSVYDWDYWVADPSASGCKNPSEAPSCQPSGYCAGELFGAPNTEPVYQISIRFCDASGNNCRFPNEAWAQNFDRYSSVYWCISGPCRAHGSEPYNHPGCCAGGNCPSDQPYCPLQ